MQTIDNTVLLTFDLEEFDMPLEYGYPISFDEQINTSVTGSNHILDLLDKHNIKATFFSTYTFAKNAPCVVRRLCNKSHELASHGLYHSQFNESDLAQSKKGLEHMFEKEIFGFRMPRMKAVSRRALTNAGYIYDSSLNPTYLPGRYNNFSKPRGLHKDGGLWQVPAATTPIIRLPLFWLSFHHLPLWLYKELCIRAFKPGNYVNLYFHPWEFVDLKGRFGLSKLLTKNTGQSMINKMDALIEWMISQGYTFSTMYDFVKSSVDNPSLPEH